MVGQGAGYDAKISLLWKLWARLYGRPATYRAFTWLATRLPLPHPAAAERLDRRPHAAQTRSAKAEGHGQRPKVAPLWCRGDCNRPCATPQIQTSSLTGGPSMSALIDALRQRLPAERVITDELRRLAYGTDGSFYRLVPEVVARGGRRRPKSAT